ncbi:hypothetical protein AKO1_015672 [Acrasis kona]|uniref:Endonuclease/exonuclease/phosphatase domain-containing protein n=1 Tax=Acrasis kona TaxID=1008807 RepID=A0AAW2ZJ04_9EUKA
MDGASITSRQTFNRLKLKNQFSWWLCSLADIWSGYVMWSLMVEFVPSIYTVLLEDESNRCTHFLWVGCVLLSPCILHLVMAFFAQIRAFMANKNHFVRSLSSDSLDGYGSGFDDDVGYVNNYFKKTWSMAAKMITLLRKPILCIVSLIGLLSNYNFSNPSARAVMVGCGVSASWLQLSCSMRDIMKDKGSSMSNRRGERQLWGVILGWLLMLYIRFAYLSLNPLFLGEHGFAITTTSLLVGSICITLVVLEELIGHFVETEEPLQVVDEHRYVVDVEQSDLDSSNFEDEEVSSSPLMVNRSKRVIIRKIILFIWMATSRGCSLGSLMFITHWLFTSSSIIPRWALLPAFPYNVLILLSVTLGCVVANVTKLFCSIIGGSLLMTSCLILCFVDNQENVYQNVFVLLILGGCLLGFLLPSMWISTLEMKSQANSNLSMSITMLVTALVYLSQMYVTSMFVVSRNYSFHSSFEDNLQRIFREKPQICFIVSCGLIVIGLRSRLFKRPQFKMEKDTALGPKRRRIPTANKRILILTFSLFLFIFIPSIISRLVSRTTTHSMPGVRMTASDDTMNNDEAESKIISYNVRQGFCVHGRNNFRDLADQIQKIVQKAHVIGLQESDTSKITSGNVDLIEYLSYHLNMKEYYGPGPRECTMGVSVMCSSNYDILSSKFHSLTSHHTQKSVLTEVEFGVTRNGTKNRSFTFFNILLGSHQLDQAKQLNETSKRLKQRKNNDVIIVGDFNLHPNSTILKNMIDDNSVVDTMAKVHGSNFKATTSKHETIDYIFYNMYEERIHLLNATVVQAKKGISDHYPVLATFQHDFTND